MPTICSGKPSKRIAISETFVSRRCLHIVRVRGFFAATADHHDFALTQAQKYARWCLPEVPCCDSMTSYGSPHKTCRRLGARRSLGIEFVVDVDPSNLPGGIKNLKIADCGLSVIARSI
jgi:hypothetical protein